MFVRARALVLAVPLALASITAASPAAAFCGFYVAGADSKALYNNATQVVLMREGTRTVLSMANNYQGPPSDFAMVVPVPIVLQKENVKTLPAEIFTRLDRLAAPRLVEYWEQDPCHVQTRDFEALLAMAPGVAEDDAVEEQAIRHGVTIEARFSVGEYDVVILGARDSLGLDMFLREQHYKIPDGAEPYLRPYVASGSKFFVAKVDAKKVRFENGQAMLSPLRFHYDSESFSLPVRLGLINSAGMQDLIVHILARSRYEVANYENFAIPTNLRLEENAKASFGSFYTALFDNVLAKHPHAVVTEYAWGAASCDPCPEPPLGIADLATLGADVLPGIEGQKEVPPELAYAFTLTRLHARYDKTALGEDLVFRAAPPIRGGNGVPNEKGEMERGAMTSSANGFQGRYVMLHPFTGAVACENPRRGIWGGPVNQVAGPSIVANNTAFAPRGAALASFLQAGEVDVVEGGQPNLPSGPVNEAPLPILPPRGGCAGCWVGTGDSEGRAIPAGAFAALALGAAWALRRKRG